MTFEIPRPEVSRPANPTRRGKPRIVMVGEAERRRAFRRAKRHSILVRVLKVLLPLTAIACAGVLFVSPTVLLHLAAPGVNATVAAVEVTTDQLRMVNPRFDGDTADKGHYVVTAEAAVQSLEATDVMQLETVHGHITQLDKSWTDLASKAGTYWTKTKALRLLSGIVITTSGAMRAELDHADIDVDKKNVSSDADVTMTMPNGRLRGKGLLIENEQRRMLLRAQVSAHLVPPKRPAGTLPPAAQAMAGPAGAALSVTPALSDAPVDIAAQQLEILDIAKTASFTGSVEAVQAGTTLRSNKMEIDYASPPGALGAQGTPANADEAAQAAQAVSSVTNTGAVVITTLDGRQATCDQSRYDRKANTMTLSGAVVLSQKTSQLHADEVVYDMAAKTTRVTAKNRVSGHFEPDAAATPGAAAQAAAAAVPVANPAGGLSAFGSEHGATDISADSLDIANGSNEAVFHGTVIVAQRGNRLTGDQLVIDMGKRHMTLTGPGRVTGMFEATAAPRPGAKPAKSVASAPVAAQAGAGLGRSLTSLSSGNDQPTNVEADSLAVDDERGQAVFTGGVVVVRGGNRITANALTVEYSSAPGQARGATQLAKIRAKDHVIVHTPDNQAASSDALLYDPARNQMILTGNVTVAQGQDVVRGEKLLVDLATGESHFETRADETAALPSAGKPAGRIQVLINPQQGGLRQIGGAPVAGLPGTAASAITAGAGTKPELSGSDVMVGPQEQQ